MSWSRREFLGAAAGVSGAAAFSTGRLLASTGGAVRSRRGIPSFLRGYEELYARDPRAATLRWFQDSGYGLFLHYGLYSQLGRGEWVMFHEQIPVGEYEKLRQSFDASGFDADAITDLALAAGMRYVTITARHHDSFCLFETAVSHYHAGNTPAKRDLIGELAEQCQAKGIGLFFYYSYALDWWHPYFYPRRFNRVARPDYAEPEPRYLWRRDQDFGVYLAFVHAQIRELLTNYGPIAGMWFDPIMGYYARPDLFPIEQTYALVRELQPQALISFKQGASGDEDFAAPERSGHSLEEKVRERLGDEKAAVAARAWARNQGKPLEVCTTLQPGAWGHRTDRDGKHKNADQVLKMVEEIRAKGQNLLLNAGPLGDGSIHPEDVAALTGSGRLLGG